MTAFKYLISFYTVQTRNCAFVHEPIQSFFSEIHMLFFKVTDKVLAILEISVIFLAARMLCAHYNLQIYKHNYLTFMMF